MKALVLIGLPMEAQTLYGPFEDHDAAVQWAENEFDHWHVVDLHDPSTVNGISLAPVPKKRFHFGKYDGKIVDDIIVSNPQYIRWIYENVGDHGTITDDEYIRAGGKKVTPVTLPPAPPRTHHSDGVPYDDDIPF